ncbi:dihydropteroate synthase [Ramlibacter sp.]|uniref:dihydropteroate synthase n=1 Tax=Ramlibacter sp. TaxID=1917967 RepID=UPI002D75002A|nr:dihydropteroate synthase [Ramlibacter sp.]HYD74503.1 dihydropteroate synthase [Ramlibacter sp.]
MSTAQGFPIRIIGERINPGFKSTKALFDNEDLAGIQALAVKQAEAGASWLNVNVGARAMTDPAWMARVIRAIQEVVDVPLSFDFPSRKVQEICLQSYDPARAGGQLPIVNSITEHRWDLMELYGPYRFKVILMASERVEDGVAKGNKTAEDIYGTARRGALRLMNDHGMPADDILVDMSVSAIVADTERLNRSTIDAIRLIGQDPALRGVHMMGGLSNIGQQLPPKAVDGSDLKHGLENAFLTLTVPDGFDVVLGTPWRGYAPLAEDHYVLQAYRHFLEQSGSNALRAVRKFYRA